MADKDERNGNRTDVKSRRPLWKDKLRESCLQRVRKERYRLLWDTRLGDLSTKVISPTNVGSEFDLIVAEELHRAKQKIGDPPESKLQDGDGVMSAGFDNQDMLWERETPDEPTELRDEEYEALMIAMEQALHEDVHAELKDRDAALVAEYETVQALEVDSLAAVVEHWEENEGSGLLCPLCRTRRLHQSHSSIICGCGRFQIELESDQVGLDFLQKRLAEVLEEHRDSGCCGQTIFSIQSRFGIRALYMQCSCCDCFQLIL